MKILFTYFLVIYLSGGCLAQVYEVQESYVSASRLIMREKPTQASKNLATLVYGDVVYPNKEGLWEGDQCDTIDNRFGCWYKVNYHNLVGYVFNAYLGQKYSLYHEDSPIDHLPKVPYWYGIYFDSIKGTESMKLVEPKIVESGMNDEGRIVKILKTNQNSKSLFIIATFVLLKEREMGVFTQCNRKSYKCEETLKPGDVDWLFFSKSGSSVTSVTYQLITTGTYKLEEYGNWLSNYEVFVTNHYPPNQPNSIIQNLTQYFGYTEGLSLRYMGDIDGDDKPDAIIYGANNSSSYEILFLSSEAKENELLRPMASIEGYDDC